MTNPYGTDPGPQPQGLGDPGNQGPGFVAPGAPGQYGAPQYGPPQYGPPQYGPPYGPPQYRPGPNLPPQPYGQPGPYSAQPPFGQVFPHGPGPSHQPPYTPAPRKRSGTSIAVLIVVLVALVVGISYGASQLVRGGANPVTQSTPIRPTRTAAGGASATIRPTAATSGSTTTSDLCVSGDTITAADFVATVPADWGCDGDYGDISLSSARDDAIWVEHDGGTGDLAADCKATIEDIGTVTALPTETWGGKPALSYAAADTDGVLGVRCTITAGQTWYLTYIPFDAKDDATVRADVTTVMSTWVWK